MARVLIQRGHCSRRSGATGTSGEQKQVTRIAELAAPWLEQHGHTPIVLGADEPLPSGDMFIALHCDGSVNAKAGGASVGYRNDEKSKRAAQAWKAAYQRRGWPFGFRADNYTKALSQYYGTGWAAKKGIPLAFIVEFGFLTNAKESAWLRSEAGETAAARSLVDVVGDVLGHPNSELHNGSHSEVDMLKRKDAGANVGKWQHRLNQTGYTPPLKVDGDFGEDTEKAVRWFQRRFGLDETGTIDLTTAVQLQAMAHGMAQHQ
jgi:hypothetical protein